jgi:hypothetical protein
VSIFFIKYIDLAVVDEKKLSPFLSIAQFDEAELTIRKPLETMVNKVFLINFQKFCWLSKAKLKREYMCAINF